MSTDEFAATMLMTPIPKHNRPHPDDVLPKKTNAIKSPARWDW